MARLQRSSAVPVMLARSQAAAWRLMGQRVAERIAVSDEQFPSTAARVEGGLEPIVIRFESLVARLVHTDSYWRSSGDVVDRIAIGLESLDSRIAQM